MQQPSREPKATSSETLPPSGRPAKRTKKKLTGADLAWVRNFIANLDDVANLDDLEGFPELSSELEIQQ